MYKSRIIKINLTVRLYRSYWRRYTTIYLWNTLLHGCWYASYWVLRRSTCPDVQRGGTRLWNQSINQSINYQSISQSVSQSVNQSINFQSGL